MIAIVTASAIAFIAMNYMTQKYFNNEGE